MTSGTTFSIRHAHIATVHRLGNSTAAVKLLVSNIQLLGSLCEYMWLCL